MVSVMCMRFIISGKSVKMNRFAIGSLWILSLYISAYEGQDVTDDGTQINSFIEETTAKSRPPSHIRFPKDREPPTISTRIVGGYQAKPHAYPFQVALHIQCLTGTFFCGGSLIAPDWVLTAAHCVDIALSTEVVLGVHNLNRMENSQVVLDSSDFFVHEDWDVNDLQNDIALIKLPESVDLNEYIDVVDVDNGSDTCQGLTGRCLGWGRTSLGYLSSVLRYVDAEIISNDNCSSYDDYADYIGQGHICTSGDSSAGSCNGDSGGPLMVGGIQVGIVSFGVTNCSAGLPSVYTRLSEYSSWILTTISNAASLTSSYHYDSQSMNIPEEIEPNYGSNRSMGPNQSYTRIFLALIIFQAIL